MIMGRKTLLQGNVIAIYQDKTLGAQEAIYDEEGNTLELKGEIYFANPQFSVFGPSAQLDLGEETGFFPRADYRITELHGRGRAENIAILDPQNIVLENAVYTTCPPEKEDWRLKGKRVVLDREKGQGTAENATLRFKNVPLLYAPYLTFPIDDRRKSGFLYPDIGFSSNRGYEIGVPYYWNIAPDRDATLTVRPMSERGVQLGTEFRYLNRKNSGEFWLEYLPSDRQTDEDRWLTSFDHRGNPFKNVGTRLYLNAASDDQYFSDFSTNIETSSTTHLERRGDITYTTSNWNTLFRVQGYQTVDPTIAAIDRPYQRLPQIRADGKYFDGPGNMDYLLNSEAVHFYRDEGVTTRRLDIEPGIRLPVRGTSYFFEPELSYRFTGYDLEDVTPGVDDQITRGLPTFSLDSGLFFDRYTSGSYRQTLEPRLFYLYTPYEDQSDIPLFDASEPTFSFGQLFRRNRFVGADRVGDANQVSAALTSRYVRRSDGSELLRGSIGQIVYFQDRKVTLDNSDPETLNRSDLAAELQANPTNAWRGAASLLWNYDESEVRKGSADLRYHRDPKHVVNLGYRFDRDNFNQTDVSFAWRLNPKWQALGRWAYNLDDNEDVGMMAGLEYENCCWKTRFVARRFITTGYEIGDAEKYNNAFYIQLVLKGLGAVGNEPNALLEQSVPGYKILDE
jgi:LPS-assembly protein